MGLRGGVGVVVAAVLAATLVGPAPPPASAQGEGFTEGGWSGSLAYNAKVIFDDDVAAFYRGGGWFAFSVQGASPEGTYALSLLTVTKPTDLPDSVAFVDTAGSVSGNALVPELVVGDVNVTSESSGVKAELTFPAVELGSPRIKLVPMHGSCGSLAGFWNAGFATGLAAQGDSIVGPQGSWVAHKNGDTPDLSQESIVRELQIDTDDLSDALRNGTPLNIESLNDVVSRAEALAVGGFRRSNCDSGEDDTRFRSRAYSMVQQLLLEARDAGLGGPTIIALINAGYRTGVFADDLDLRAFYDDAFDQAVDAAIESGDQGELLQVHSAARQLGKTELADEIAAILELLDS